MLTHHRTAAERRESDVTRLPRAGMAVAGPDGVLAEVDAAALCRRVPKKKRSARGRIHLMPVVHFQHLDVEVGAQRFCGLPYKPGEQVDPDAHVTGFDNDRMPR